MNILNIQKALAALGHDPGPLDGAMGPRTRRAVRAFQQGAGLMVDGIPGPATFRALKAAMADTDDEMAAESDIPPWMEEMLRRKGLHENRNHNELHAWLKSAGSAVDPAETPWCGDAVETAILRALPDAAVPANPMASIKWLKFGRELDEPTYGAVLVFWRGSPDGWQGHVGFYVGESDSHYHVLGGNQSNAITITKLTRDRLRPGGIRWPDEYPLVRTGRIAADGGGLIETTNEA